MSEQLSFYIKSEHVLLALGILCLILGRKLVWLVVATIGFVLAQEALTSILADPGKVQQVEEIGKMVDLNKLRGTDQSNESLILVLSAIAGIAGAVFTKFFKNIAVVIAGYTIAGVVLSNHASEWGIASVEHQRLVFIAGGIVGSLVISFLLDAGLMLISIVLGADLILKFLDIQDSRMEMWMFAGLSLLGFLIQGGVVKKIFDSSKKSDGGK